jgi:hypothetical protein
MTIQHTDINRIKRICNHEAGHYIVARELSFTTHGIAVLFNPIQGHSGHALIEPWTPNITSVTELTGYLERRIKVLFAGAISEAMEVTGKYDADYACGEWETGGSTNDHSKIRELVQTLRNIKYPETNDEATAQIELTQIDEDLIKQTGAIVYSRIELIHGIGDMLFQKVKEYNVKYELLETEINKVKRIRELYIDKI